MQLRDIKTLKKRVEAVSRGLYERGVGHSRGQWLNAAVPLSISIKQPAGGFCLYRFGGGDWLAWEKGDDGMTLRLEGDWQGLLAAFERVERDIDAAAAAELEAARRSEQEYAETRRREKETEKARRIAAAQAQPAVARVVASLDKIERVVRVAARLEDASAPRPPKKVERERNMYLRDGDYLARINLGLIQLQIWKDTWRRRKDGTPRQVRITLVDLRRTDAGPALYRGSAEDLERLASLLESAEDDPLGNAIKAGICLFCERELTDTESKRRGYGKICGDHENLPWGTAA
jgi:hypothetical protein